MFYVASFKKTVLEFFPNYEKLSSYLSSILSIFAALNISIPWLLPNGLEVYQSYQLFENKQLNVFDFNSIKNNFKLGVNGKINRTKQRNALMPNLIHSLDGATIALLYDRLTKLISDLDIYTLHDCFGVKATDASELCIQLRLTYLSIYSSPGYLAEFDARVRNRLEEIYKRVIKAGDNIKIQIETNKRDEETKEIITRNRYIRYPYINLLDKSLTLEIDSPYIVS